jgi:hypothetical protein
MKYILILLIVLFFTAIIIYLTTRGQKDNFSMLTMDSTGDLSIDNQIIKTDDVGVTSIKTSGSGLSMDGDLTVDGGISLLNGGISIKKDDLDTPNPRNTIDVGFSGRICFGGSDICLTSTSASTLKNMGTMF